MMSGGPKGPRIRPRNPSCIDTASWGSFLRSLAIAKSDSSVRLRAAPLNLVEALSKIAA